MPSSGDDFRTGGAFDLLEAAVPSVQEYMAGRQVGPYRLVEPTGSGGMGTVFRAVPLSEHRDRDVALKLLGPGFHRPDSAERFRRGRVRP